MKVDYDVWNNDLTIARQRYEKDNEVEVIKIEFASEAFQATKILSVAEAEELMKELSDHIRWLKGE